MKAVGSTRPLPISDPASLEDFELLKPDPEKRDLLVRVEAISVNPVDTKIGVHQFLLIKRVRSVY